jgi:acyl carrier protein
MTRDELKSTLTNMLVDNVGREFPNLKDADDLRTDLGLDSVDLVTLLIEVQTQLQIIVPTEEVVGLKTVGDLLDHLHARLSGVRRAA